MLSSTGISLENPFPRITIESFNILYQLKGFSGIFSLSIYLTQRNPFLEERSKEGADSISEYIYVGSFHAPPRIIWPTCVSFQHHSFTSLPYHKHQNNLSPEFSDLSELLPRKLLNGNIWNRNWYLCLVCKSDCTAQCSAVGRLFPANSAYAQPHTSLSLIQANHPAVWIITASHAAGPGLSVLSTKRPWLHPA